MGVATLILAASFIGVTASSAAAPGVQHGRKATPHTRRAATRLTEVRYKAHCGMVYSAADAKKYHYICPMDHKPLTKITVAAKPAAQK